MKKTVIIISIVVGAAAIGFAAWYFLKPKKGKPSSKTMIGESGDDEGEPEGKQQGSKGTSGERNTPKPPTNSKRDTQLNLGGKDQISGLRNGRGTGDNNSILISRRG